MFQKQKSDSAVRMPFTDAISIIIFDICLPTWDVFSDLIFAFTLITPQYYEYSKSVESHPKFGIAMLVPMLFTTFFILREWWNMEKKNQHEKQNFHFCNGHFSNLSTMEGRENIANGNFPKTNQMERRTGQN